MHMIYPDWREKIVFAPDGPRPQILAGDDGFKVVLGGLEPGQRIPLHAEDAAAVFHFLEGSGWVLVDSERLAVQAGATVIVPAGAKRGMEAQTRLAFLATRVQV